MLRFTYGNAAHQVVTATDIHAHTHIHGCQRAKSTPKIALNVEEIASNCRMIYVYTLYGGCRISVMIVILKSQYHRALLAFPLGSITLQPLIPFFVELFIPERAFEAQIKDQSYMITIYIYINIL